MAEFVQTMKDWRRMCQAYKNRCDSCPLASYECGAVPRNMKYFTDKQVEGIIVAWAAEHPEPVYPTFGEWLEKQGIVKLVNSDRYEEDGRKVYILLESVDNQIPADIAQKLGIKPNGVK